LEGHTRILEQLLSLCAGGVAAVLSVAILNAVHDGAIAAVRVDPLLAWVVVVIVIVCIGWYLFAEAGLLTLALAELGLMAFSALYLGLSRSPRLWLFRERAFWWLRLGE